MNLKPSDSTLATVFQRPMSSSSTGLPPELVARSRTRLAVMLGVLGLLSAVALLLGLFVFLPRIETPAILLHVCNIGVAALVAWTALTARVPASLPLHLGLVYKVLICWAIAFVTNEGQAAAYGRAPHLNWASILIVIYPMLIPLPPRRLLVSSILAALGTPASLIWLQATGRYDVEWMEVLGLSLSPAFAVVLAYMGARLIYSMSMDASRARAMGAYQLEARLGRGGMGEVWRAHHRMLARPAAVKLIAPDRLGADPRSAKEAVDRFQIEAQATAALRSPHTVQVYDYGVAEDGSFYYVMELLDGLDLQELVTRHGPLPASRVVYLLLQACHSLGEAHGQGMIHRDVKPANIFTCRYGPDFDFVKVLDFGLVRQRVEPDGRDLKHDLTRANNVVGTPAFLAPEMASSHTIDARADLYSLGCVAYWLLTGTLVFEADTPMKLIAAHLRDAPPPPSARTELEVPEALERVVLACLEKDPSQRPGSAEELAQRLTDCGVPAWGKPQAEQWWKTVRPAGASRAPTGPPR